MKINHYLIEYFLSVRTAKCDTNLILICMQILISELLKGMKLNAYEGLKTQVMTKQLYYNNFTICHDLSPRVFVKDPSFLKEKYRIREGLINKTRKYERLLTPSFNQ